MKSFFLSCIYFFFAIISSANGSDNSEYLSYAKDQIKKYQPLRKDYIIIIDYRKSIFSERLFVLDLKKGNIILTSTVSHAWKSGIIYAKQFSNKVESNTSSKGNFLTKGTYYGKFGYSMIIKGLDQGINDKAQSRSIIFHSDKKMKTKWSWGCFATPDKINKEIIDKTKNGVLVCVIV